ncbi:hypothetical protein [Candidatus Methylopumilus turicensis]|uniref:Uncharacterized protein n=1 Tax=Candidatus Methylopumilus turicensis TaxID=1581680 RepID=A0A0B7ITS6_9PROT|nr:hypothetical protein [Candidatus Methylopumilus turicensis]CEN55680.1 conserved exported protein of unknown function [Candidatus Methylopumilus turicensis]
MLKKLMILMVLIGMFVAIYLSASGHLASTSEESTVAKDASALRKAVDDCAGIADNAVANMTAIVEFQKLEIQGRKINVIRRCMADHGFTENPGWLRFATPVAHADALAQKISDDEAIENLRRKSMMELDESSNSPIYWKRR